MSDYWMTTYSGGKVVPAFPQGSQFNLFDIATSLSRQCRFLGHTLEFYSVAQHSILVAAQMPTVELQREALLHDGPEAYLGDLSPAVRQQCPEYIRLHERFWSEFAKRFNLPDSLSPEVVEADIRMLLTEKKYLLRDNRSKWAVEEAYSPYYDVTIVPWPTSFAKETFLNRLAHLFPNETLTSL